MKKSIRKAFVCVALTAAAVLLVIPAYATVLLQINVSGKLTGATGVKVDRSVYNVQFMDGSCVSLFYGCDNETDFVFHTEATARLAAQALLSQVFIDGPHGNFDSSPNLTEGCGNRMLCDVITPYARPSQFQVDGASAHNEDPAIVSWLDDDYIQIHHINFPPPFDLAGGAMSWAVSAPR